MAMRVWIFLSDLTLFPLQALPEAANSVQFQFTRSFQTDVKMPWGGGINYHRQPYLFTLTWKEPGHPASLDAEGRIQVPKHRNLLLFESPAVTQVADTIQYDPEDFTGDCRPLQSGWRAREIPQQWNPTPILLSRSTWAKTYSCRETKLCGDVGCVCAFSSHFQKTPLVGLKKLQLARA